MDRLSFGISVTPAAAAYREIVSQVLAAERGGLDLIGIQDHPYQRRFLDTFALIGHLMARTTRLRFFPDVASLPMRSPTMLAKAAASLDAMSGGRFELGLGAGTFWDAIEGMGGQHRAPRDRIAALEEAVRIIRAALDVGQERRVVRGRGPVDQWIETLASWAREHRVDAFVIWPPDTRPDMVERLAADVVPAVREELGVA